MRKSEPERGLGSSMFSPSAILACLPHLLTTALRKHSTDGSARPCMLDFYRIANIAVLQGIHAFSRLSSVSSDLLL